MIEFLKDNLGNILVIGIIVSLAIGVLVRYQKRKARGQSGCSSCSGCAGCSGCASSAACSSCPTASRKRDKV